MPTSKELVSNRPLSGTELRTILARDLDSMLGKDGMFSEYIGYGRVAYDITVKLHIDNPSYPEHSNSIQSKSPSKNEPDPLRGNLEPPPLTLPRTEEAAVAALERSRVIDSPNQARVEFGLPVLIPVRDMTTGQTTEKAVVYDDKGLEPGKVEDKDISVKAAREWEL